MRDGGEYRTGVGNVRRAALYVLAAVVVGVTGSTSSPATPTTVSDPTIKPDNPRPLKADMEDIWRKSQGQGQRIAVLDTGVLAAFMQTCNCIDGTYNAVDENVSVDDLHGHGTGVTAAIIGDSSLHLPGVAPRAKILAIKVTDKNGLARSDSLKKGFEWALSHGASVINISLGTSQPDDSLSLSIEHATTRGVPVIAAAGNGGGAKFSYYPAALPGAIPAIATDDNGKPEPSSNVPGNGIRVPISSVPAFKLDSARTLKIAGAGETSQATAILSGLTALHQTSALSCGASPDPDKFFRQLRGAFLQERNPTITSIVLSC